ncbi:alkaline phosphatase, tissue-nonspecific isozyme-like [Babylonia areolata]|uniref:alkaline phosphatase, tissue-nonspecific isozyme-like n=1 Tax=Babylonia areolata TaxID=304850 RepID=UPI003FD28E77
MKTQTMVTAVPALLCLLWATGCVHSQPAEEWNAQALKSIREALQIRHNTRLAKNVILFIGDGMGVSTVTAARIYKGQRNGRSGEETRLHFETFPHVALSKTYNTDRQTADSAGTATAFLCGVKANLGTIGVDSSVPRKLCHNVEQGKVSSILTWFHHAGKSTGLVTTSRITHATPSAAYAHSPERYWEGDSDMETVDDLCKAKVKDMSAQLMEDNPFIKVIMGGGRRTFLPNDTAHPDTLKTDARRGRRDKKNLIEVWQNSKPANTQAHYVWNVQQLDSVDVDSTDYLLGLFNPSHMEYELKRDPSKEPSLAQMVSKAVNILRKDPNGFFLLVEGARIDHAHHDNQAHLALAETVAMDDALAAAMELTGEDTLMVVTADHSHVFNIAGYPQRGNDILGLVQPVAEDEAPYDGMPYATLVYANGPGPGRVNLTDVDTASVDHQQSALVRMPWETHGGEDVAIYARGPMAHLFHGVHEQNYIAHVMAYAACVGPHAQHCERDTGYALSNKDPAARSQAGHRQSTPLYVLCLQFLTLLLWGYAETA